MPDPRTAPRRWPANQPTFDPRSTHDRGEWPPPLACHDGPACENPAQETTRNRRSRRTKCRRIVISEVPRTERAAAAAGRPGRPGAPVARRQPRPAPSRRRPAGLLERARNWFVGSVAGSGDPPGDSSGTRTPGQSCGAALPTNDHASMTGRGRIDDRPGFRILGSAGRTWPIRVAGACFDQPEQDHARCFLRCCSTARNTCGRCRPVITSP
jgi:hypothetical protein